LRGYLETGNKKRKGVAADAGASVEAGGLPRTVGTICADTHPGAYTGQDAYTGRLIPAPTIGTLCARDYKGVGNQYVQEGKCIPCPAPQPFRKSKRACSTTDNETWVPAEASNTLNNFDLGDTRTTHAVVQHQMPGSVAPTIGASGPPYSRTGNERVEAEALAVTFQPGNLRREAGADPSFTTTTTLKASAGDQTPHVAIPPMAVRRLTPVECERLQGFPDNWSRIPWKGKPEENCVDGPRYKACGNSMAVPCMFWIGERIAAYELNNPSQTHETK